MNAKASRIRSQCWRNLAAALALTAAPWGLAAEAPAIGVPSASPNSPDTLRQAARADYVLQCAGCHRVDGRGSTPHGIPDFRNSVGAFVHLPEAVSYTHLRAHET